MSVCVSVCWSLSLAACLSVCLSVPPSVWLCFCLSVWQPACLPVCLTAHLSVRQSVCLSDSPPHCQSVCLSVFLSVWQPICLSVCLSVWQPTCLSVCLSLSVSVILSVLPPGSAGTLRSWRGCRGRGRRPSPWSLAWWGLYPAAPLPVSSPAPDALCSRRRTPSTHTNTHTHTHTHAHSRLISGYHHFQHPGTSTVCFNLVLIKSQGTISENVFFFSFFLPHNVGKCEFADCEHICLFLDIFLSSFGFSDV